MEERDKCETVEIDVASGAEEERAGGGERGFRRWG